MRKIMIAIQLRLLRMTKTDKKLSCRGHRAMLRVIEYFAKSLKVTDGHLK